MYIIKTIKGYKGYQKLARETPDAYIAPLLLAYLY